MSAEKDREPVSVVSSQAAAPAGAVFLSLIAQGSDWPFGIAFIHAFRGEATGPFARLSALTRNATSISIY